ncbi:MAG: hypothetical protein WBG48_12705 [Pricia sp.]
MGKIGYLLAIITTILIGRYFYMTCLRSCGLVMADGTIYMGPLDTVLKKWTPTPSTVY